MSRPAQHAVPRGVIRSQSVRPLSSHPSSAASELESTRSPLLRLKLMALPANLPHTAGKK